MEILAGRAFGEYYSSFINLHVKPGSIVNTWFFLESLTEILEQLTQSKKTVFKQEGVEEVTIAGRVVFSTSAEKVSA